MRKFVLMCWLSVGLLVNITPDPLVAQKASDTTMQASVGNDSLPDPLKVEDAVRIGLARNPQTTAGQAGVAAAAATYHSLASLPSPQLGITRDQGTSTAPGLNGTSSDTVVDLGETLDFSGQRRFQAAGARAQLGVTQYQFEETKIGLAQQIRDAYWSLVVARAQTQIALESLQDVQRVNQLTHTQEQAGASPRSDVIRSSIDVANAQQSYVMAQGAERAALLAFNTLLARAPNAPVHPADDLAETTTVPDIMPNLPDLSTLNRQALTNRPLIKSAQEQVHVAEYGIKQARAARLPDLTVDYQRSVQDSFDTFLFGIRFPLLDLGDTRNTIKAAEQTRKQAQAQELQAEQQVTQQIAQAFTDFTQARDLAAGYQKDILQPSVTLLDMAQLGYKQGATGILPVIDAETTLRNARTGYINSLLALYKARDEIIAAVAKNQD